MGRHADGYAAMVTIVTPAAIAPTITCDPADDQVLAAALAAQADLIVSSDAHLLGNGLRPIYGVSFTGSRCKRSKAWSCRRWSLTISRLRSSEGGRVRTPTTPRS